MCVLDIFRIFVLRQISSVCICVFSFISQIKLTQSKSNNSISLAMGNIFAESKTGFWSEEMFWKNQHCRMFYQPKNSVHWKTNTRKGGNQHQAYIGKNVYWNALNQLSSSLHLSPITLERR